MAKRFTDPKKWDDPWFCELSLTDKLFWIYLCDACNHAGIWKMNKRLAEYMIGDKINWEGIPLAFGERITMRGNYWFIPKFASFQYGKDLNKGKAVRSAIEIIEEHGFGDVAERVMGNPYLTLKKHLARGSVTPMAMATAKAVSVCFNTEGSFNALWNLYPRRDGRKSAFKHFKTSVKTQQDLDDIQKAIKNYVNHTKDFERQYIKNGSTFFNNWKDWVNYGANDGASSVDIKAELRAKKLAEKQRIEATAGTVSLGNGNPEPIPGASNS